MQQQQNLLRGWTHWSSAHAAGLKCFRVINALLAESEANAKETKLNSFETEIDNSGNSDVDRPLWAEGRIGPLLSEFRKSVNVSSDNVEFDSGMTAEEAIVQLRGSVREGLQSAFVELQAALEQACAAQQEGTVGLVATPSGGQNVSTDVSVSPSPLPVSSPMLPSASPSPSLSSSSLLAPSALPLTPLPSALAGGLGGVDSLENMDNWLRALAQELGARLEIIDAVCSLTISREAVAALALVWSLSPFLDAEERRTKSSAVCGLA